MERGNVREREREREREEDRETWGCACERYLQQSKK